MRNIEALLDRIHAALTEDYTGNLYAPIDDAWINDAWEHSPDVFRCIPVDEQPALSGADLIGLRIRYHGSIVDHYGTGRIIGTAWGRYELRMDDDDRADPTLPTITRVRRESFTVVL